jgi:hypothetical protein
MTTEEYRTLYNLIRRYQLEDCILSGKAYHNCDYLLTQLFPHYYNQNTQQER